jgi:RimJ/RimL family protein N-acetyltransferase
MSRCGKGRTEGYQHEASHARFADLPVCATVHLPTPTRPAISAYPSEPFPRYAERLVLRRFRPDDIDHFQDYRGDPEVGRFQGWVPMRCEDAGTFLAEMGAAEFGRVGAWLQIAIADPVADTLLGDIGIHLLDTAPRSAEIGFTLARSAQRRGFGLEAVRAAVALLFEANDVRRIECVTDRRNVPSIRLLRKLGMRHTNTRQALFKGEPCEEEVYVLARRDWLLRRGG